MAVIQAFILMLATGAALAVGMWTSLPAKAPTHVETPTDTVATTEASFPIPEDQENATENAATPALPIPATPIDEASAQEEQKPETTNVPDAELNTRARAALVNVFCTTRSGGTFKPLSGSGVVIDPRGVILTNAHIAQYLLLRDYPTKGNISCTIRGGSPAVSLYEAHVLYVSPTWVEDNAAKIDADNAKGTGENDFALLLAQTNKTVAFLPYSATTPKSGERMLLAAYPAGFLSGEVIAENLYPTSAFATVLKKYTFDNTTHTDLFSVGGSIVSQSGSSGGAAVRMDGTLAGIISTAVLEGSTGERDLRAITIAHIERSLAAAGLGSLADLLAGNVQSKAITFEENVALTLTKQLISALRD